MDEDRTEEAHWRPVTPADCETPGLCRPASPDLSSLGVTVMTTHPDHRITMHTTQHAAFPARVREIGLGGGITLSPPADEHRAEKQAWRSAPHRSRRHVGLARNAYHTTRTITHCTITLCKITHCTTTHCTIRHCTITHCPITHSPLLLISSFRVRGRSVTGLAHQNASWDLFFVLTRESCSNVKS